MKYLSTLGVLGVAVVCLLIGPAAEAAPRKIIIDETNTSKFVVLRGKKYCYFAESGKVYVGKAKSRKRGGKTVRIWRNEAKVLRAMARRAVAKAKVKRKRKRFKKDKRACQEKGKDELPDPLDPNDPNSPEDPGSPSPEDPGSDDPPGESPEGPGEEPEDPYNDGEDPTDADQALAHFASKIQPILENQCMSCHQAGRFGMFGVKPATSTAANDENVVSNYESFFEGGLISFESPEGAGSRLLAKLRTDQNTHAGIPGVPHMNADFVVGGVGDPTYEAFKDWILMEMPLRAPERLGYYSPEPSYLCYLARERADWNQPPHRSTLFSGTLAKILCSKIDRDHKLYGPVYDITRFLEPTLPTRHDFQRLVASEGGDNLKLYTSIKKSSSGIDSYNLLEIALQTNDAGDITGATSSPVLAPEFQNSSSGYRFRKNSIGDIRSRSVSDYPCAVYDGKLLFYSGRGDPNPRFPQHPDPSNRHVQDPDIPYYPEMNFAENYHGSSLINQTFWTDESGVPALLIPNIGTRHTFCAVGLNGKVFSGLWDNRTAHVSSWLTQFFPDFINGSSELLPPLMSKTTPGATGSNRWEQMAVSSMGPVAVTQQTYPLKHGGFIEAIYHDLGVKMTNPPADQAPSVQALRDTGAVFGGGCTQIPDQRMDGIDYYPIRSINGATFYTASTNEVYDPCDNPAAPSDLGIFHYPGAGVEPSVVLSPLQQPIEDFADGYFVDALALLTKRQPHVVSQPAPAPDSKRATIHFTNLAAHIALVSPSSTDKQELFESIREEITHVRVYQALERLQGFDGQNTEIDDARGSKSRTGFEGVERTNPSNWLGDIPIAADGSVAFTIPAGIHWYWQALKEYDTARGTFRVAVFQPSKTETSKAGLNDFVAFRNMDHYRANCMSCHGATGDTVRTVRDMVENHGGTVQVDTLDTLAMDNPVDLYTSTDVRFTGFAELVQPALNEYNCMSCHNNNLTDGISFSPNWHPTATDPSESVAWTNVWSEGPYEGEAMGSEAPFSPGYFQLVQTIGNSRYPYLNKGGGHPFGGAYSGTDGTQLQQECGLFLHVLGVDIGDCSDVTDTNGDPFEMPSHDHTGYFTHEQIQNFIVWVDRGVDFRSHYPSELAPSYSDYDGETRAALEPSE